MSSERKSVQSIRTMGALVDSRRTRSAAGALLELSAMANEKLLLEKELGRWSRRRKEIMRRLEELAAKEGKLLALVKGPGTVVAPAAYEPDRDYTTSGRVKVKEFSY